MTKKDNTAIKGEQRLSLEKLHKWETLKYGMFIHFGMSTFDECELPDGNSPSTKYAPSDLDVAQWIRVAKEAGMKYAVLTTKHVAGHCLWPSEYTDYSVKTSSNTTDVVGAFVEECRKQGLMPGLYYCSWDNHTRLGSVTPSDIEDGYDGFTTREYQEYMSNQIRELLTNYGDIGEVWIDIPPVLGRAYRTELYNEIASLQPEALILMNNGIGDGENFSVRNSWPSDLIPIERYLPNSNGGYRKWRTIEGKQYYMPGEVCDPIGKEWFYTDDDAPRSDAELLGMYLVSTSRGTNFLLDVGPDKTGKIPKKYVDALMRLKNNIDKLGM